MKGKIKVKLISYYDEGRCLILYLKLENELFYYHKHTILTDRFETMKSIEYMPHNVFCNKVIEYLSDKNNIIKDGEDLMKQIIEEKLEKLQSNLKFQSKEKQVKELLKKFKQPIKIEIKGE